jgi:hypothetical protein
MRLLHSLITSLLLLAGAANAGDSLVDEQSQGLKDGLTAMRSGDKTKAWALMFPQAQRGNVQSMYYLGEMMLRSPEYDENLDRALKFFTVAASKGHAGAKAMIPRVKSMLAQTLTTGDPTIAGMSGVPSKLEIDQLNTKLAKYKAELGRFTDNPAEALDIPRIEVMVFLEKADSTAERFYAMTQALEQQFGTRIKTRFFMVINPSEWSAERSQLSVTSLPPNGFTPDFKGHLAEQHGVRSLPAVVILPPNGQPKVVSDLSSLSSLITNML